MKQEKKLVEIPSPSQLNAFLRCGVRYKLRQKGYPEDRSMAQILGTSMHWAVAGDAAQYIRSGSYCDSGIVAAAAKKAFEENVRGYEFPYSDQKKNGGEYETAENAIISGLNKIEKWSEQYEHIRDMVVPEKTEVELNAQFQTESTILKIRARVDLLTADGIIDYKFRQDRFKAVNGNNLQFILYKWIVDHATGKERDFHVIQVKEGDVQISRIQFGEGFLERTKYIVQSIVESLESGIFVPADQESWACKYCGFMRYCPYTLEGQVGGAVEKIYQRHEKKRKKGGKK